jgi:hypothetical protein
MNKSNKFSDEVRERAVRMVQEHPGEYRSKWAAIESIAPRSAVQARPCWDGSRGQPVNIQSKASLQGLTEI